MILTRSCEGTRDPICKVSLWGQFTQITNFYHWDSFLFCSPDMLPGNKNRPPWVSSKRYHKHSILMHISPMNELQDNSKYYISKTFLRARGPEILISVSPTGFFTVLVLCQDNKGFDFVFIFDSWILNPLRVKVLQAVCQAFLLRQRTLSPARTWAKLKNSLKVTSTNQTDGAREKHASLNFKSKRKNTGHDISKGKCRKQNTGIPSQNQHVRRRDNETVFWYSLGQG